MKYLVVEDQKRYRNVVEGVIAKLGNKAVFAADYESAEKLFQTEKFDRVITDLFFPELSKGKLGERGEQLLKFLRSIKITEASERCVLQERYAPLGLYVFGKAYQKGIPALITSQGDRHYGSLGFVRYRIQRASGIPIYHLMALGGDPFDKEKPNDWERAIEGFVYAIREASILIPKIDPTVRMKIFGF